MKRKRENIMTPGKNFFGFILSLFFFAASAMFGCGHGGGDSDSNPSVAIDLKPVKAVALADGIDVVTVKAAVENLDGTAVPDGTSVDFSAADSTGQISLSKAATVSGRAS